MNYFTIYGAALLLALLIASPALDKYNLKPFGDWKPKPWRSLLRDLWACEHGVVSVTYYLRGGNIVINGSTTAPTATQAQQVMMQKAIVQFGADADVQAFFTHNWGLDISAPGFFEPEVFMAALSQTTAGTWMPCFTFDWTNTNMLAINKLSFLNTAGKYVVYLRRPHSVGQ